MNKPLKLRLPAGFYKNGTEYMGVGRYIDGDLVRWHNEVIRPIEGWVQRYDLAADQNLPPLWGDGHDTEAVRSGIVMGDPTLGVNLYLGSNKKIYEITNTNAVNDVTPAGFVPQPKDSSYNTGYGLFRYSFGQYGTPRPAPQGRIPNVFSWGFGEWGYWPVTVARELPNSPVYVKRETDTQFVPIAGSPEGTFDCVVTDERILMTVGSLDDYRLVQWCDQEDFDVWTPAVDNQAGTQRLAGTGKLVSIVKVLNQNLILGENDAFVAQYIGPPYVYGFQRVGDRCGIIGPEAVAVTDTFAVWIGALSFWIFDGTVRQLPCEVLDFYLQDKRVNQRSKTQAFTISDYSEVWWLYQSKNAVTSEPDSYIVYNYAKNAWYTGRLDRTFGIDADPMTYPLMVKSNGQLYDHEVPSAGREGRVPWIETGPLELNNGQRLMSSQYVYPDHKLSGDVRMEMSVRDMPNQPARYTRDFQLLNPTSTHGIMGRDIRMKLYGALVNPNWTIGDFRVVPSAMAGPQR